MTASMDRLVGEIEAQHYVEVTHETWGHLAPENYKRYHGQMTVAKTIFGQTVVIDEQFPELLNSPWQYDALHELAYQYLKDEPDGAVYTMVGWLEWTGNNDECNRLGESSSANKSEFEIIRVVEPYDD